ncbi:MAG: glycosyltransferase family 4 protein [Candidatus Aminicenantes bacterium]|nr:glycosyltransferase family 4 protein [Candidatus Aminicenantes bacterium]
MKILMIAPEPFFEPRGTPFSEYFRIKALSALGHTVDLVTYPFGVDKHIPGLKIFRCAKFPWITSVRTGPSLVKVGLDFFLLLKALRRLWREDYDLIHTHEEASLIGVLCQKMTKIPHLYDMHSSLVQQMGNFNFTRSRIIVRLFKFSETVSLKNATAVIVICRSLFDYAAGITAAAKLTLIENFMDDRPGVSSEEKMAQVKGEINADGKKVIMYAGTLEAYQGIPLLLESMRLLGDDFRLVVIGGKEGQVAKLRRQVEEMELEGRIMALGQKRSRDIPYYLHAAAVLVSPRILGTNIPLKIYSYLASGVPVVATDLPTHTQSVSREIAFLAAPDPEAFAAAIRLAAGPQGEAVASRALAYCREHFTVERYTELVAQALAKAVPSFPAPTPAGH